jgi:putative DNA primase/helicase
MARAAGRDAEAGAAEPTERRLTTQDPTVEALGELLRDNPNIGVIRDELTGLLRSMEKPDRGADRAFYLEAWDGNRTTFQYDRIGRGKVTIKNPTVSILGSIQPGPLRALLREVARGESGDDGLIFRFQVLFWPDLPAKWTNVDRWPDSQARRRVDRLFRALGTLTPADLGAEPGDGGVPPHLRFDDDAQPAFDAWRNYLENYQLRGPDDDAMLEAHLAKYRKLVPALALLFHLAEALDPDRPADSPRPAGVSLTSLERAVKWHEVLQSHARRVYGSLDAPDIEAAQALLKKFSEGQLPSPFSYREVYGKNWGKLDDALAVRRAVALLEELGWVQTVEVRDTGGGPRADVHLHPRLPRKGDS